MSDPIAALRAVSGSDLSSGATDLPNIPQVPASADPALVNILSVMKSWMEKAAGSGATGFASKQELISAGLISTDSTGNVVGQVDMRVPPVPTGLVANGAMTNILVQWTTPVGKYANHGYTEVWAAEIDDFSQAVMVGQAGGFVFSHAVGEDSTRFYWIRFVSTAGVKGPYNAVGGTQGNTAQNVNYLIDSLTEVYGTNGAAPFFYVEQETTINGVVIPPGVYIKSAFIAEGTITTAMIKNATIDSAQITGKLTANQINADQLNVTNGTFSGQLVAATGVFSGNLQAASGTFRGELVAATGTFSGSLSAGTVDLSTLIGSTYTFVTGGSVNTLYVPEGYTSMRITMVAGGGGGGAGHWGEWAEVAGNGGGGGAGEYVLAAWDNLPAGAAISVGVGAGGAGGNNGAGGTGGESYVNLNGSRLRTAYGGGGGGQGGQYVGDNNNMSYATWATGYGGDGGGNAENGNADSVSGLGGSTLWGSGGVCPGSTSVGTPGSGFGAGGGGGGYGSPRAVEIWPNYAIFNGGAGAGGKVIVEFYNPNAVVLRTEFTGVQNRITTVENQISSGTLWQQNVNMTSYAVGSLAVMKYYSNIYIGYWTSGWVNARGDYIGGAWRELCPVAVAAEWPNETINYLCVRIA